MASDRKTPNPDGPRASAAGDKVAFPSVRKTDPEDVSWALSTAEAMWNRGDHAEAVKWVRRAAEAASECDADTRALELAKIAADLSSPMETDGRVTRVGSSPLQQSPSPAPPLAASPAAASPIPPGAAVPAPPSSGTVSPPPLTRKPLPPGPRAPASARGGRSTSPSRVTAPGQARVPAGGTVKAGQSGPRVRRKSMPSFDGETTAQMQVPQITRAEAHRPVRSTSQSDDEPNETLVVDRSKLDPDAWPTAALVGDPLGHDSNERTRIGTPAYTETAIARSSVVPPPVTTRQVPPRMSQAVRVRLFRGPDGLRIAPEGFAVEGEALDAVLVLLDPTADLTGWLTGM